VTHGGRKCEVNSAGSDSKGSTGHANLLAMVNRSFRYPHLQEAIDAGKISLEAERLKSFWDILGHDATYAYFCKDCSSMDF